MSIATLQHLEARLRNAHVKLNDIAKQRDLEHVFVMELFSLSETVEEALASGSRGLIEHALEDVRLMELQLKSVPAKRSPSPGSEKIDR